MARRILLMAAYKNLTGLVCSLSLYWCICVIATTPKMADARTAALVGPAATLPYHNITQHQLMIQALRGKGRYMSMARVLDYLQGTTLRRGITILAPYDDALARTREFNTTSYPVLVEDVFLYTITLRLPFQDLRRYRVGSKLQTAIPGVTATVTRNEANDYQINNAQIIDPDLYIDDAIAVHGINSIWSAAATGRDTRIGGAATTSPAPSPTGISPRPLPRPTISTPATTVHSPPAATDSNHDPDADTRSEPADEDIPPIGITPAIVSGSARRDAISSFSSCLVLVTILICSVYS